jgi:acyl-coenzyme A thioesterase PaaI-like protein
VAVSPDDAAAPPRLPTTPPPDAVLPERHPEAPPPGSPIGSHYDRCFGCGAEHPAGMRMHVVAGEGLTVHAVFEVGELHQGAPGLAHGGLLAAAFDEALGASNWLLRAPAVTGRLETDFRRPVPVGSTLHIDVEIVGQAGRKVYVRAEGRIGSQDGPLAVTAAGLFVQVGVEHFRDHGRPQDVEAAWRDGRVRSTAARLDLNP